jgi:lipopolysaccharide transport system ATP-binding protein
MSSEGAPRPRIRARGLSKLYRLGRLERRTRIGEVLADAGRDALRRARAGLRLRARPAATPGAGTIWALRDVSFDLAAGEVLGLVGPNGAGKSTLLKILTRITAPTTGLADLHGRVGSLLEVGTGFHSELTGRENVFLNGAVLGMRRAEITRKFDEIVAFSEVERFLDTPVKRYSSGMYMRLAFAVAAHLDADIMLVDEVLAVGDAAFQRKCLGKMGEVARGGRTVIFVSHNLAAVQSLCDRVLRLDGGRVVDEGDPGRVVSAYLQTSFAGAAERSWPDLRAAPGNDRVRLHRARVRPAAGAPGEPITVRTPFLLEFEYWNLQPGARLNLSLHVYNEHGVLVLNALPLEESVWQGRPLPAGLFRDVCRIPGDLLNDGRYWVELLVVRDESTVSFREPDVIAFDVLDSAELRGAWFGKWPGVIRPVLDWRTELLKEGIPGSPEGEPRSGPPVSTPLLH